MARPGNRRSTPPPALGTPGNRIPGALLLPQTLNAAVAAARLEQVSALAATKLQLDDIAGEFPPSSIRTVTTNDAFGPSDSLILVDASAGPVTAILPLASAGARACQIRKVDATANAAILAAQGGDTINGLASLSTTTQFDTIGAATDGISQWTGG